MEPAISLILPIYQVEAYVAECLRSIMTQTFTDFELLVVDDCGTDESMHIAHELLDAAPLPFAVRYYRHERNRGLSAARNTGCRAAVGKYLFFVDSDDRLLPDSLALLYERAEASGADVVIGNLQVMGDDRWIPRIPEEAPDRIEGSPHVLHAYLSGQFYVMAWNKLLRRDFAEHYHLDFEEGLVHEDGPWSFRLACVARRVVLLKAVTYQYRVRSGSLQTAREFGPHHNAYLRILRLNTTAAKDAGVTDDPEFMCWLERQKALYFNMTLMQGDARQLRAIYDQVRNCLPQRGWSKLNLHYRLPHFLGLWLYRRTHKHWLC